MDGEPERATSKETRRVTEVGNIRNREMLSGGQGGRGHRGGHWIQCLRFGDDRLGSIFSSGGRIRIGGLRSKLGARKWRQSE